MTCLMYLMVPDFKEGDCIIIVVEGLLDIAIDSLLHIVIDSLLDITIIKDKYLLVVNIRQVEAIEL